MRKRALEVLAVLAIVAAVVASSGKLSLVRTSGPPIPPPAATPASASTPEVRAQALTSPAAQTSQATSHWRSTFEQAQAALNQGDNARAEALLVSALRLAPMAGPEALHETLDDLGLVCYRLGEYERSAEYQQRAVSEAGKLALPQNLATVALYETRYALALEALDRRSEALAALERAETAYKEAYPAGSPAYAEAMSSLAAQHRGLGNNEAAARLAGEE